MSWRLPRRSFLQPSTFYSSSFAPSRTFARVIDVETQLNGHSAHAGSTPAVNRNRRAKSLRVSTPAMATLTHLSSRSRLRRLRRRLPLTARTVGSTFKPQGALIRITHSREMVGLPSPVPHAQRPWAHIHGHHHWYVFLPFSELLF